MTDQSWLHRKAPTGLKTYPAWSTDPTRFHLDTALDSDTTPARCWPCVAVGMVAAIGLSVWGVSALRWMGWI